MSQLEKALALASLGLLVFPCREVDCETPTGLKERKSPYTYNGFLSATGDTEQIATWWTVDHPDALVGVWTGASGLVVADMDRKHGKDGFASIAEKNLLLTPTLHYATESNGEHWIYWGDADLPPAGNLSGLKGVDRRSGGSYIIFWGDVPDDLDEVSNDIPEWLAVSAPQAPVRGGFDGEVEAWLGSLEEGDPDPLVRSVIRAVPTGEFNHDEMIGLVFHAVRLGAELHTGVPEYIEAIYREWLRSPYDTDDYRREIDVALLGAIRKAGALEEPVPDLLPGAEALSLLPESSPNGTEFVSMLSEIPQSFDEYDQTEARRILIREILAAGVTAQAALTVVWNSRIGEQFRADKYGREKLWREVLLVKSLPFPEVVTVTEETPATPERNRSGLQFLTDTEEAYLADQGDWFGTSYLDWVRKRVPVFNGPYHRMAMWLVLSLVFSEQGHVRTPSKKHNLSMFGMTLGQSTTGKTESFDLAEQLLDAYYRKDDSPYVGNLSKMSPNGLHRALIMRDGRSSLVRSDEAQGLLSQVKGDSWQNALLPDLADYYEGRIRPMQKTGDREASGMSATGNVVAHLTGIEHDVFENLEIPQWKSGLLLRFVWAIGDPYDEAGESFEERQFEGEDGEDFDMMPKQWAAEFSAARFINETIGPNRFVKYDQDALDRHSELNRQVTAIIKPHRRYEEVLRGAKVRFMMNVRKAATIVALCEASETVTLRHELIAVKQAEEWLGSMIRALDRTAETQFERETEEVYKMIIKEAGAELPKDVVYKAFKPMERADRILRQLAAENRVFEKSYKERGHVLVARVAS